MVGGNYEKPLPNKSTLVSKYAHMHARTTDNSPWHKLELKIIIVQWETTSIPYIHLKFSGQNCLPSKPIRFTSLWPIYITCNHLLHNGDGASFTVHTLMHENCCIWTNYNKSYLTTYFKHWFVTITSKQEGHDDFLSFHYSHIMQNSPAHWRPCFLTNQHGLKESESGSLKEHFYKIIWKSACLFRRRRFFKFSL